MDIKKNLEMINNRIETACRKAGRHPSEVTLLPVTKTIPCSVIKEAFPLGLNRVGENMVQEAKRKAEELQDFDIDWCVIGHLQKNKAKYVAKFAKELHSLDNLKLASELDKRLQIEGRSMDILIQVNSCANTDFRFFQADVIRAQEFESRKILKQMEKEGFLVK